jgi:hypothetical protein
MQIKRRELPATSTLGLMRKTWLFCLSLGWLALVAGAIGFVLGHWWQNCGCHALCRMGERYNP